MWGVNQLSAVINLNNAVPYWSGQYFIDFPINSVVPCSVNIDVAHNGSAWAGLTNGSDFKNRASYRIYSAFPYSELQVICNWKSVGRWK